MKPKDEAGDDLPLFTDILEEVVETSSLSDDTVSFLDFSLCSQVRRRPSWSLRVFVEKVRQILQSAAL